MAVVYPVHTKIAGDAGKKALLELLTGLAFTPISAGAGALAEKHLFDGDPYAGAAAGAMGSVTGSLGRALGSGVGHALGKPDSKILPFLLGNTVGIPSGLGGWSLGKHLYNEAQKRKAEEEGKEPEMQKTAVPFTITKKDDAFHFSELQPNKYPTEEAISMLHNAVGRGDKIYAPGWEWSYAKNHPWTNLAINPAIVGGILVTGGGAGIGGSLGHLAGTLLGAHLSGGNVGTGILSGGAGSGLGAVVGAYLAHRLYGDDKKEKRSSANLLTRCDRLHTKIAALKNSQARASCTAN